MIQFEPLFLDINQISEEIINLFNENQTKIIIGVISALIANGIIKTVKILKYSAEKLKSTEKSPTSAELQKINTGLSLDSIRQYGGVWYIVTIVLLVVLTLISGPRELLGEINQINQLAYIIAIAVGFSSILIWAWVWHRFFHQMGIESTVSRTIRMFLTGHFLNGVTPLGQSDGEPIIAYIVSDTTGADYKPSLGAVISSSIVNAVPFFTFPLGGIIYLAAFGTVGNFLLKIGLVAVSLLTVGGGVAYLLWSDDNRLGESLIDFLDRIEAAIGRGETVFASARESVHEVADAFQEAGSDRRFLLTTTVGSHLAIVAQIVSLYFVFRAMGLDPVFVPLYFLVPLSTFGTLSPTPGGSGTYEVVFSALMMTYFSVGLTTAFATAILFRLTTYWLGIIAGFLSMLTLTSRR